MLRTQHMNKHSLRSQIIFGVSAGGTPKRTAFHNQGAWGFSASDRIGRKPNQFTSTQLAAPPTPIVEPTTNSHVAVNRAPSLPDLPVCQPSCSRPPQEEEGYVKQRRTEKALKLLPFGFGPDGTGPCFPPRTWHDDRV